MKKIDLTLMMLFMLVFANGSFAQVVGPFPGGDNCAEAVPIFVGNGYKDVRKGSDCESEWFSFTAPCTGVLKVTDGSYSNGKRLYSGSCGSLTLLASVSWSGTVSATVTAGETVYFEYLRDNWCGMSDPGYGDWNILFENPACPQPTSLVSMPTKFNEGTVAWFGSAESYTVIYGPSGFDPKVSGTTIVVVGTVAYLKDLSDLTCYDVYVQSNCSGGEVSCFFTGPTTFCTPAVCPMPILPNTTVITSSDAKANWSSGGAETAWEVEWGEQGFLLGTGDFLAAPIKSAALGGLTPAECYDWYVRAKCSVDLGYGLETVYSLWVGPTEFCAKRSCLDPSGLAVVAAPGTTAKVKWNTNNLPAETEWNIQYGAPGFVLGSGVTITNIPSNPYTITGLTGETNYCFYVQAVCGEGPDNLSNWVGPVCFKTATSCPKPKAVFAEGTTSTEAELTWTPSGAETNWTISWGLAPLAGPLAGTMETASVFPTFDLTGLTPNAKYCYYVRSECGGGAGASAWAGPFCWTQPDICTDPFNVKVINITNTAANVTFAHPGAKSWNLEWGTPCFTRGAGEETGSVSESDEYPYYMTGLDHSTPYEVYVQSVCGTDSLSSWVGPILFGTKIKNDNPCTAEELVLDAPAKARHNFGATILPGEALLAPPADDCYGSKGWCSGDGIQKSVWFSFVAPATGKARVSTFSDDICLTNGNTEIAIYKAGDCGILANFELIAANTLAPGAGEPPYGSQITGCGLTPGTKYYVLVNPIGFMKQDITFNIEVTAMDNPAAGLGLNPTVCAGTDYDLFNAIAGSSSEDGTWYHPTVAPGNKVTNIMSFPDVAASYDLFYVINTGCDEDMVKTTISTERGVSAGGNGYYTACNAYDIVLSDHLTGYPTSGGDWELVSDADTTVALAGGLFSPLAMAPGIYKFLYVVSNEYCPADSSYVTITLTECTGIDEVANSNFVVYPNPVIDILTVQNVSIEGNALIEVVDIEGRVVIANQVSDVYGNYTIDMSRIESGVYFVKVTSNNEVQKVRIVKQ